MSVTTTTTASAVSKEFFAAVWIGSDCAGSSRAAYQRSDRPSGGKASVVPELKDMSSASRIGPIRKTSTRMPPPQTKAQ